MVSIYAKISKNAIILYFPLLLIYTILFYIFFLFCFFLTRKIVVLCFECETIKVTLYENSFML